MINVNIDNNYKKIKGEIIKNLLNKISNVKILEMY